MAKLISAVYGDALFEAAAENQMLAEVYEETVLLSQIFCRNQEWIQLLNHPRVSREETFNAVRECLEGRVSEELLGFFQVVLEKRRQAWLIPMLAHFMNRVKEYRKIGTAYVTSAVELEEGQKKELEETLLHSSGCLEIQMYYTVDPTILGGLIVRIGERVMDGSIKTRLDTMKQQLSGLRLT